MSFATPSSLAEFSAHFENAPIAISPRIDRPYYYEGPTNTINFGYGINLTAAAANPKVKAVVDQALRAEGISLTNAQWAAIGNVTVPGGSNTAISLNNALPTNGGAARDWKPAAANLKEAFYSQSLSVNFTLDYKVF